MNARFLETDVWLMEPGRLRHSVGRVLAYKNCPTARELVEERRRRLDEARQSPSRALQGRWASSRQIEDEFAADVQAAAGGKGIRGVKGKVGVIPIHGPLQQRMTTELMKSGGTSTEEIGVALDSLLADKSVEAIVLNVDSPGGSSWGTQELADKIYAARGQKPIYTSVDPLMASAAAWIGTAADDVSVTPSGDAGSIGVYTYHIDESKALEQDGIKVSLIHAGKFKVEGNSFEPLGEEALAHWQESVNEIYGAFVGGMKRNRNVTAAHVEKNFGQGRLLSAKQAVDAGLADRILSFEGLLTKLLGTKSAASPARSAKAEVLRLRQAQQKRTADLLGIEVGG